MVDQHAGLCLAEYLGVQGEVLACRGCLALWEIKEEEKSWKRVMVPRKNTS